MSRPEPRHLGHCVCVAGLAAAAADGPRLAEPRVRLRLHGAPLLQEREPHPGAGQGRMRERRLGHLQRAHRLDTPGELWQHW